MAKQKRAPEILSGRVRALENREHAQMTLYAGNPNGALSAAIGVFCWDTTNSVLYINTDGATAWTALGGGSSYVRAHVYDTVGALVLTGAWQGIPFDQSPYMDGPDFTYSSPDVTCNFDGVIDVRYDATLIYASGSAQNTGDSRLAQNGVFVPGTLRRIYGPTGIVGTSGSASRQVAVSNGDTIRVEVIQSSGGGNMATLADGSSMIIERIV